ncbi:MAG TPA: stage II sporulation protein M [Fimbriimonas sp.]
MNEQTFVDRRQTDWVRLTQLCDLADRSPTKLSPDEMREFVRLYRRVSTDLAVARTRTTSLPLVEYLNDIAGRSYAILYRSERKPLRPALRSSIALAAQTVRKLRAFVLASAVLFFGSGLLAYGLMSAVPDTRDFFVPPGAEELFRHWKSGEFKPRGSAEDIMMAGFYASNNPRAAIVTAALGAGTFGIGSLWMLVQNGNMLGALAKEVQSVGNLDFLLSSIAPHGVPELSGIVIAGAAGLLFGWALINPGRRTRGDALRAVGRDGMVLILTSVVLMFIAAPIEAFFSFNPVVPGWLKTSVALLEIGAWAFFWVGYARSPEEATAVDSA